MRYTFEAIKDILEDTMKTEVIFNVDYQSLKDQANRLLEKELSNMRDNYRNQPYFDATSIRSEFAWDTLGTYVTNFPSKKMMKQFAELKEIVGNHDPMVVDFNQILDRWVSVCVNFKKAKAFIVKGRKPSDTPRTAKERTVENTGTCACCGKNVKLRNGKIVAHGYTIAWGFQQGNCFGVGFDPIEVSDEGLVAFKNALKDQEERIEDSKAKLIETRPAIQHRNYAGKIIRVLEDGDDGYETFFAGRVRKLNGDLEMTKTSFQDVTKKIENWKPGTLPG